MLRSTIPPAFTSKSQTTFTVDCGLPFVAALLTQYMVSRGASQDTHVNVHVLVDLPSGFALRRLEQLTASFVGQRIVVLTSNTCPEYQTDLSALHPGVVLVEDHQDLLLWSLHHRVSHPNYRAPVQAESVLTVSERRVLRYVASGWTNDQIAEHFCVQEKTIRNTLTRVNAKLGIASRYDAMLYYFGHPVVLPDSENGSISSCVDDCGPMSLVLPAVVDIE